MVLEELIAEETDLVTKYYNEYSGSIGHEFSSHEQFVRFALHRHRNQIEQWGGLRFVGPAVSSDQVEDRDIEDILRATAKEKEFYKLFESVYNNQRAKYTRVLYPPAALPNAKALFKSRLFQPEEGFNGQVDLWEGLVVKIRKGQSTSRAVLKAVREKFGETHIAYKYYSRVFELLGHSWTSNSHLSVTFSVAPSDVLCLGHLNIDAGSCYKAGGQTQRAKLNILAMEDAAVMLVHRGDASVQPWSERGDIRTRVSGRAWGFVADCGLVLHNTYGHKWPVVTPSLLACAKALYGSEVSLKKGTATYYGGKRQYYPDYGNFDRSGSGGEFVYVAVDGQHSQIEDRIMPLRDTFTYLGAVEEYKKVETPVLVHP